MEQNYSNHQVTSTTRANFLYPNTHNHSVYAFNTTNANNNNATAAATTFHLQRGTNQNNHIYQQQQDDDDDDAGAVKIEASGSHQHHHHHHPTKQFQQQQQYLQNNITNNHHDVEAGMKAKIVAHPQYPNLLQAYLDCQKVGAPPEVMERLAVAQQELEKAKSTTNHSPLPPRSKDPELDQFMEAYCDMLVKYRQELIKPIQEAMEFMTRMESQLNTLASSPPMRSIGDEKCEGVGSSEEEQENSGGETDPLPEMDPRAEDRELKNHLLKKYSGYLSSLKQELSKKKKKGKLPKDARQKLLSWWELHYKWPYPSETEKVALAETTGLDPKQINNWFINQRKRHWKPSEDMQFMVMDGLHPQNTAALYMEGHYLDDGPYRLGP